MENNYKSMNEEKKRKIILVVGAICLAVLIGLVVSVLVVNNLSESTESEYSDGEIVGDTQDKHMLFENLDYLTMIYNIEFSTNVASDIEKYAFLPEEMKYSGENNSINGDNSVYYDATIDVGSIKNYDELTCGFDVDISDRRKYKVITKTDSIEDNYTYLYVAITRDGGESIAVFVNGDAAYESIFADFVKEQFGKNVVTTVDSE